MTEVMVRSTGANRYAVGAPIVAGLEFQLTRGGSRGTVRGVGYRVERVILTPAETGNDWIVEAVKTTGAYAGNLVQLRLARI